jgi:aminopeptidase 2
VRTDAFVSLGYADDSILIQRVMGLLTDDSEPFSPLEKWFLLNALQTHRTGAEASWTWLKTKWGKFGRVDSVTVSRYTASCTSSLSTVAQLEDVQKFALSVEVSWVWNLDWVQWKPADNKFRGNTKQPLIKPSKGSELE